MYAMYIKRIIDLIISICAFPFFIILFVIIAPFIFLEDHGSVFYRAKRRGLNGCVYEMYKFRSMKMDAPDIRNDDNSTYNSPDDPRITKIGRVLRKTSIDEIPQIINVLKGDMSIIGPRPTTIDKPLELYDEKRLVRLKVKPGITGYTQAYYRNSITQEEKFEFDAQYALEVSFILDTKIFFRTIYTVLAGKNIYNS
ncbi:MAG: sugar transferase [Dorea sp.]|nr:sugar transferase [Dorea sp.]